jgi:Na+:H+ antiporter, NhaA family
MTSDAPTSVTFRLQRPIDLARDHVRGGGVPEEVRVVVYGDFLCPYCQRLRQVLARLRRALGSRFVYVFRHFPAERFHPGAELAARASEAASNQGRFWEMHDWIYDQKPPVSEQSLLAYARSSGLDMVHFEADLRSDATRARVDEDIAEARRNGVTGTPTLFVDGVRYDGAWDFHSMLEALEPPMAARLKRSARAFASLPASGGLVLLLAAAAALLCANTPLAARYGAVVHSPFSIGPPGMFSMTVAEWCAEGIMTFFFLLVGLEIRREMTAGALADRKAATLPVAAAVGGVVVPALIYLACNRGPTYRGWAIPTATDIAFTIGILAVLGDRIPTTLRVFVAALAVTDDVLSVVTLAASSPDSFELPWLGASLVAIGALFALNRARVYATWPYGLITVALWAALHASGVHAALAGVLLAAFLPTQPAPAAGPLLAQAATALAELEHAEKEAREAGDPKRTVDQAPIWDWASRNLTAASERLLSPADRVERAVAPWSNYVVLPLFAFSAMGVRLHLDTSSDDARHILLGVILGLVVGKPLGVLTASWLAIRSRLAVALQGVSLRQFVGAACLCGVSDTVALLMADHTLSGADSATSKIGLLMGTGIAAALGTLILYRKGRARTATRSPQREPSAHAS